MLRGRLQQTYGFALVLFIMTQGIPTHWSWHSSQSSLIGRDIVGVSRLAMAKLSSR